MIRVKIISDGTPQGTRVVDHLTGETIVGVKRIEWDMDVNRLGKARLTFVAPIVEVVGDAEEVR